MVTLQVCDSLLLLKVATSCRLIDIATQLDMDLELEVYPLVRFLVFIQRVKIVDVIRPKLGNVFLPNTTTERS